VLLVGELRYKDSVTGALVVPSGSNGAIKTQIASSAGAELFTSSNPGKVVVDGVSVNITAPSADTITATPVTGVKTVTATAAEIFAGASALSGRKKLLIRNDDQAVRMRVGASSVTQQSGFPVEPGAVVEFSFDAATAKVIYAISEGAAITVEVWES